MNKILIQFMCLLFFSSSCTVSPRYSSSSQSIKSGKLEQKKYTARSSKKNDFKTGDVLTGISSWYGPNFHGKLTANGEVYDQYGVTAAHKTLPLGTVVRVTNLDNEKSIILRINDRGPYVGNRILDCSYGAAIKLGFKDLGTASVKIEIIELGDGVYMHHNN